MYFGIGRTRSLWYRAFSAAAVCGLLFLGGCAGLKEGLRGFAGISTKVLEDSRPQASSMVYAGDFAACYQTVKRGLKRIEAYIYAEDTQKHLIALYVSESDTTPVGIFLAEQGPQQTKVEVSSPSTSAREYIAAKLFPLLDKMPPEQQEGKVK